MKKLLILAFTFIAGTAFSTDLTATTKDGKQVILKPDGTWHFQNEKAEKQYNVAYAERFHINRTGRIITGQ